MSGSLVGRVTALAWWGLEGVVHRGTNQRPVLGHLLPLIMTLPWWMISTAVGVNMAVQPASQNWEMDTRHFPLRDGNRWPVQAVLGALCQGMVAVWVEVMMFPLGSSTCRGVVASWTFRR